MTHTTQFQAPQMTKLERTAQGTAADKSGGADTPGANNKPGRTLSDFRLQNTTQIWKSRLSWRITLAVFLTIMVVQTGILAQTVRQYETNRLMELEDMARASIMPQLKFSAENPYDSPIQPETLRRIISSTRIKSVAIYTTSGASVAFEGPQTTLMYNPDYNTPESEGFYYAGDTYEFVLSSSDIYLPFQIIVQMDSRSVAEDVQNYIQQSILITLLMSAFVTSVLMLALGWWLLEPILFMRENLQEATENPENPRIPPSPYDSGDEIGGAIEMAQRLIRQNADNVNKIKSAAEDQIHKLAYYDSLTGLPNRTMFLRKLSEQARTHDDGSVNRFVVIAMDLDHFKDINDTMGHNIGDAILRGVGKRLRSALPASAIVSRAGEDEFAVTMPLASDNITPREVAERIAGVIRAEPFKIFNESFQIRASMGTAVFPDDAMDPAQVIKNADIALNRAKEEGRDIIKEYSEDFDKVVQARFKLLRDLRTALDSDELSLNFQPQLDLKSGHLIGAEALLRWWKPNNSKEGGQFISPVDFIPVAEQSGLIIPIGEWVLRKSCEVAASWPKFKDKDIRIAVNVSAAQFHQGDLPAFVEKTLQETGLDARRLELEVTESIFMDDMQHTIDVLQTLHTMGVEIAIDDFGTGYSSLSYLRQLPIDRLKIDQSFIRNALNNADDASIARTIVALAHSLNLRVIAEGVETIDHEKFLQKEGCDEVQGFRYSKPVPPEDFLKFAESYDGALKSFKS